MDTLPTTTAPDKPAGYIPFSDELDFLTLSETETSSAETSEMGQRVIVPNSWWRKTGSDKVFFVKDRDTKTVGNRLITTHIYLYLQGDSNAIKRTSIEFWTAHDAGKIENLTYR